MISTIRRVVGLVALVLFMAGAALAHHSFAMFDHTKTLTLRGAVTKFQWTNPHAYIELDVTDPKGAVTHFSVDAPAST